MSCILVHFLDYNVVEDQCYFLNNAMIRNILLLNPRVNVFDHYIFFLNIADTMPCSSGMDLLTEVSC